MTEHGSVALNGFQFTFLAAGPKNGEPAILLHGFPQFADVWTQLLTTLGGVGFRAVALDQRGYCAGARPQEIESYGVAALASDVIVRTRWDGVVSISSVMTGADLSLGNWPHATLIGFAPERSFYCPTSMLSQCSHV